MCEQDQSVCVYMREIKSEICSWLHHNASKQMSPGNELILYITTESPNFFDKRAHYMILVAKFSLHLASYIEILILALG